MRAELKELREGFRLKPVALDEREAPAVSNSHMVNGQTTHVD